MSQAEKSLTCETIITVKCTGQLAVAERLFHARTDFQYRVSIDNDNVWLLELRDCGLAADNDSGAQKLSNLLLFLADHRHNLNDAGVTITHISFHHFKANGQWGLHLTADDCRALETFNTPFSYCPAWNREVNYTNDFPERFNIGKAEICCHLVISDPHGTISPHVITSELGLQPTISHVKGETAPSGRHNHKHHDWRYRQCLHTTQPLEFLSSFLHRVKEKRPILERLELLSHSHISFFLLPDEPTDTCPITLSPEMIRDFLSTGVGVLVIDPTPSTFFRKP